MTWNSSNSRAGFCFLAVPEVWWEGKAGAELFIHSSPMDEQNHGPKTARCSLHCAWINDGWNDCWIVNGIYNVNDIIQSLATTGLLSCLFKLLGKEPSALFFSANKCKLSSLVHWISLAWDLLAICTCLLLSPWLICHQLPGKAW